MTIVTWLVVTLFVVIFGFWAFARWSARDRHTRLRDLDTDEVERQFRERPVPGDSGGSDETGGGAGGP